MKVIIVAQNVSTRFGGEAILPWHYFRLLRERGVEAWLVCHERTRKELLDLMPEEADRMRFVPDLTAQRWLYKLSGPLPKRVAELTLGWVSHILTSLMQAKVVRELVAQHDIDIVHEPIPVSPKQPSLMYSVGAPVVIGPMNGGMTYPPAFAKSQGAFERSLIKLGRKASAALNAVIPGKRRAALLLVANDRTRHSLPAGVCQSVLKIVENGVDLSLFHRDKPLSAQSDERPKFAFVGALIELKGVDLLLEAAAIARKRCDFELHIIGDGKMRHALEAQSIALGLADRVTFHGFIPQDRCPKMLASCAALVLPSLCECGGAVVLEAMAMGLPVIATNWGGPADYLDETSGILVEPSGRESFISDLADALVRLGGSKELRETLGQRGRQKVVADFDWQQKIDRILEIYGNVIEGVGSPVLNRKETTKDQPTLLSSV